MPRPFTGKNRARNSSVFTAIARAMEALEQRIQFDATYANLAAQPLVQDWTTTDLITANDTWTNVPSIEGYRGDNLTASPGSNPNTNAGALANDPATITRTLANQTSPETLTTGAVAEFD